MNNWLSKPKNVYLLKWNACAKGLLPPAHVFCMGAEYFLYMLFFRTLNNSITPIPWLSPGKSTKSSNSIKIHYVLTIIVYLIDNHRNKYGSSPYLHVVIFSTLQGHVSIRSSWSSQRIETWFKHLSLFKKSFY